MTARPSKPWRLALSTAGAPIYEAHSIRARADLAAERHIARIQDGTSRITRIRLESWGDTAGRWVHHETLWPKDAPLPT